MSEIGENQENIDVKRKQELDRSWVVCASQRVIWYLQKLGRIISVVIDHQMEEKVGNYWLVWTIIIMQQTSKIIPVFT